jgi:hypothetical protein
MRRMPEPDTFRDRLEELLDRWEDGRAQSMAATAGDLTDDPELAAALGRAIEDLQFMEAALGGSPTTPEGPALGVPARFGELAFHEMGGMGVIYRAFDAELRREVAYKVIRPHLAGDRRAVEKFVGEARVTARLQHPGVVPVYGLSADGDGRPAYAMRFVEGTSLLAAVDAFHATPGRGKPPRSAWLPLLGHFVRVCQTIHHAHGLGVLHRDLAPRNVLLLGDGETFVIDWGLASETSPSAPAADDVRDAADDRDRMAATRAGTAAFTAPEVFEAGRSRPFSERSDVYSLGALLCLILTGRPPFSGDSTPEVVGRVLDGPPPDPDSVPRGVPRPLWRTCARALSRDPGDRYPTAEELSGEVEAWIAGSRVGADREPAHEAVWRLASQHPTATTSVTLSAVLALVVLVSGSLVFAARGRARAERSMALESRIGTVMARTNSVLIGRRETNRLVDNELLRSILMMLDGRMQDPVAVADAVRSLRKLAQASEGDIQRADKKSITLAIEETRTTIAQLEAMTEEFPESAPRGLVLLAVCYNSLGALKVSEILETSDFRADASLRPSTPRRHPRRAELESALEILDRARELISKAGPGLAELESEGRSELALNALSRYLALIALARYTETLQALATLIEQTAGPAREGYVASRTSIRMAAEMEQWKLPWSRGPAADHARAVALAAFLAEEPGVNPGAVYNTACAFSLASTDPAADAVERRRRADGAIAYLRRNAAAGYFQSKPLGIRGLLSKDTLKELLADADLDHLRDRPDFKALVAEVSPKAEPGPKGPPR